MSRELIELSIIMLSKIVDECIPERIVEYCNDNFGTNYTNDTELICRFSGGIGCRTIDNKVQVSEWTIQ